MAVGFVEAVGDDVIDFSEGDMVAYIGRGSANTHSSASSERQARKITNAWILRSSRPIMEGLIQVVQSLLHRAHRSITFDRGTEFTDWPLISAGRHAGLVLRSAIAVAKGRCRRTAETRTRMRV